MSRTPDDIEVVFVGVPDPAPLILPVIQKVASALDGAIPEEWAPDERRSLRFSETDVLGYVTRNPNDKVYARRRASPQYEVTVDYGFRSRVACNFAPDAPSDLWPKFFSLADELAEALKPDIGTAHIGYRFQPWANTQEKYMTLMSYDSGLFPVDYYREGPRGLAMRTYIGPAYVEQFGEELLSTVPVVRSRTSWGAYRLDLVDQPWAASDEQLVAAWERGMRHLRPAGVFANVSTSNDRYVHFSKAPNCRIPLPPNKP